MITFGPYQVGSKHLSGSWVIRGGDLTSVRGRCTGSRECSKREKCRSSRPLPAEMGWRTNIQPTLLSKVCLLLLLSLVLSGLWGEECAFTEFGGGLLIVGHIKLMPVLFLIRYHPPFGLIVSHRQDQLPIAGKINFA